MKAISIAVTHAGSRANLARALGLTPEAVRKWELGRVPAERCRAVERAVDGVVTAHQLRPDIFDPPQEPSSLGHEKDRAA
jgi:DNA-binding transcriptional regulator YdaS (Cro superfamily)